MKQHIHYYVNTEDGRLLQVTKEEYLQAVSSLETCADIYFDKDTNKLTAVAPKDASTLRSKIRATYTAICGLAEYCDKPDSQPIEVLPNDEKAAE